MPETAPIRRGTPRTATAAAEVDAEALARALHERVRGEVRFDAGSRALYSTDASNYRQLPIGVVVPRDAEDVIAAVSACREHGAPLLSRGGGTSLAGQCCNVAVVLDFSKYMRGIALLDPERRLARVQPGIVLDELRAAAEAHHLTFGPDPATHSRCTLGGMIGNNSCGVHSIMAGKTEDNVEALDILTYDGLRLTVGRTPDDELERIIAAGGRRGDIYARLRALRDRYADLIRARYPDIPRRVSGFNLPQLLPESGFNVARALVGTESTCVTVLEAMLRLVHSPPFRTLVVLGYDTVFSAGEAVPEVMAYGPVGLEGFDGLLVDDMRRKGLHLDKLPLLPEGRGWLLVELAGESEAEALDRARRLIDGVAGKGSGPAARLCDAAEARQVWAVREAALAAGTAVPGQPDQWEGWEDAAVRPDQLGAYLRDFRALLEHYGYRGTLYGHFGHGCIHSRISFDLVSADGITTFRRFVGEAADLVLRYGGSLSGEHGDGQARGELLPKMFGPELVEAFREFKAIWDPQGRMNPGKVVDPYPITADLRLGTDYDPLPVHTHFAFPEDEGSFARATLRCVGVGACRRASGGTMCPSYRATLEEKHSTRGRARLLFEMLEGDPLEGVWRNEAVREALDLCLACKGCKRDCPVSVDMATYKAEFLAHYYEGRRRPMHMLATGLFHRWARLASHAPRLANALGHTPPFSILARRLGGFAPERELPRFATRTFRSWFEARTQTNRGGRAPQHGRAPGTAATRAAAGERPAVLLWPDTFNDHLTPGPARAAVRVLEAAGFDIRIPARPLCCGRPLYDAGMLDTARALLREILEALAPDIEAGIPVVGLEPSCVAVFRDELPALFPADPLARRLADQTFGFGEFLARSADLSRLPRVEVRAVVHGHCHEKALVGMGPAERALSALGVACEVLDSGCCGLAGSFGFQREHYEVSMRIGEQVLLPAVRALADDVVVVADGFSCREQIRHGTGRRALHTAEVMAIGLEGEGRRGNGEA